MFKNYKIYLMILPWPEFVVHHEQLCGTQIIWKIYVKRSCWGFEKCTETLIVLRWKHSHDLIKKQPRNSLIFMVVVTNCRFVGKLKKWPAFCEMYIGLHQSISLPCEVTYSSYHEWFKNLQVTTVSWIVRTGSEWSSSRFTLCSAM